MLGTRFRAHVAWVPPTFFLEALSNPLPLIHCPKFRAEDEHRLAFFFLFFFCGFSHFCKEILTIFLCFKSL